MRAGAERRRENDGRDVGEVRARADADRLPHAVRAVTVVSHVARYLLADNALRQRHQVRLLEDPAALQ